MKVKDIDCLGGKFMFDKKLIKFSLSTRGHSKHERDNLESFLAKSQDEKKIGNHQRQMHGN